MPNMKVYTLDEVRAQIAARTEELRERPKEVVTEIEYGNAPAVIARDEALERVCEALAYMERSIVEVKAARDAELNTLRAELNSLRGARRAVERQLEADDGAQSTDPETSGTR